MIEYEIDKFRLQTEKHKPDLSQAVLVNYKEGEYLHIVVKVDANYYNLVCVKLGEFYKIVYINSMDSKFFKNK